jgi:exoribonuclease II
MAHRRDPQHAAGGAGGAAMTTPKEHGRGHHRPDARTVLRAIAVRAMTDYGLDPAWPPAVAGELAAMAVPPVDGLRDLRGLPWSSIDNDDSRDLDQLEVCVEEDGRTRVLVAVADVDALVAKGMAIDDHARANTTSVYTIAQIFPMLPEALSTDLTSLGEADDRPAIVVDMTVASDGGVAAWEVYRATVRNKAKLAYHAVSAWLDGDGALPDAAAKAPGLDAQLTLQDTLGRRLRERRMADGALEFERGDLTLVMDDGQVRELRAGSADRAREIIESFMVAANSVVARFLTRHGWASIRRIVREPKRWGRIVELAAGYGATLPDQPDSQALQRFLAARRAAAPDDYANLSLSVLKLMGRGQYVADGPGGFEGGHFALAQSAYTHSTAPNRRFPDLVTQRLVKAAIAGARAPYSLAELEPLAEHCTRQEDAATKVERRVRKSAAAMWLSSRIGEVFPAVVTGASSKGTWVRLDAPPLEGKVEAGAEGLDVGDRVRVRLVRTDVDRGFVDFARVGR